MRSGCIHARATILHPSCGFRPKHEHKGIRQQIQQWKEKSAGAGFLHLGRVFSGTDRRRAEHSVCGPCPPHLRFKIKARPEQVEDQSHPFVKRRRSTASSQVAGFHRSFEDFNGSVDHVDWLTEVCAIIRRVARFCGHDDQSNLRQITLGATKATWDDALLWCPSAKGTAGRGETFAGRIGRQERFNQF